MSNDWLSTVFGNDGIDKTAQSMFLDKLAQEEGIDISELSDEQLDALAQQVAIEAAQNEQQLVGGQDPQQMQQPQQMPQDPQQQQVDPGMLAQQGAQGADAEMQMKVAEADALGRVMARSMIDEVEKNANEQAQAQQVGPLENAINNLGGQVQRNEAPQAQQPQAVEQEKLAAGQQFADYVLNLWHRNHGG